MFKNYLKVAIRNIINQKIFSFINLAGLSIGMSACFLILLFIRFEISYENFHTNKEDIYRVIPTTLKNGAELRQINVASAFGPHVYEQFREVTNYSRLFYTGENGLWKYGEDDMLRGEFLLVDSGFLEMFTFPEIAGNVQAVLKNPTSIIISEKVAETNFPNENPIGKTIEWENEANFIIGAVIANPPDNSHIQFDYLASVLAAKNMYPDWATREGFYEEYNTWNYPTYYQIESGTDIKNLQSRVNDFLYEKLEIEKEKAKTHFWFQNLSEIHFTEGISGDTANGNIDFIYAFSLVALFVLLIACINFTNLSTAIAIRRAREVGLRKTLGARKTQLIQQFLSETVVMALFSFVISLGLIQLALPYLDNLLNRNLSFSFLEDFNLILLMASIAVITGILSGSYPGLYLSSYQPIQVLKGKIQASGGSLLRKVLTVFQFSIASLLIIFTITVYFQMNFMKNSTLGFDKEQVVYLYPPEQIQNSFTVFKQQILNIEGVESISRANAVPGRMRSTFTYIYPGNDNSEITKNLISLSLEPDYIDVLNLEIVAGRNLSEDISSDALGGYLINETAVEKLGFKNPVGHPFMVRQSNRKQGEIVGVVKDFHFASLKEKLDPLVMWIGPSEYYLTVIKLNTNNLQDKIAAIENVYKSIAPDFPFDYQFLDQEFDRLYKAEEQLGTLLMIFASLSVFIACLGLFGLTAYIASQRKKEIGIRKVLGASVKKIMLMLSSDFTKLVFISFVLISPISWWFITDWLEGFAYRIDLDWQVYGIAGAGVLFTAIVTVSFLAFKAAIANPVNSLKND